MQRTTLLPLVAVLVAGSLAAQNSTFPMLNSAPDTTANEATAPYVIPSRMTQRLVVDRTTLVNNGLNPTLINWDMVAFDPSSRFIFIPAENFGGGGGVFRYDTQTGAHIEIFTGNNNGPTTRNPDPTTFNHLNDETNANDPCTWTPWNTIVFGEESTGGRFFECTNPLSPNGPFNVVWHGASIPAVRHEGMRFDGDGYMYFIDESNSGSIYRFIPDVPGDLSSGAVSVLSIDGYANDPNAVPSEDFSSTSNRLTTRLGSATWVPLTGPGNTVLTPTDPFSYVTTSAGATAADEVFGTPFGRPEDLDIGTLANGNEAVYVALTSENRVISIELVSNSNAIVRDFVNYDTINFATGMDVNPLQADPFTSPGPDPADNFDDPDNIAIDLNGDIYILEDETPGDIWKAIDRDGDGVAEGMGIWISLGIAGSEPTGLIFDPNDPYRCICNIQHPSSGNDALWEFSTRPYPGSVADITLQTGVDSTPSNGPGEFVRTAPGGSVAVARVDSPNGTLYGQPFATMFQFFLTANGQPTFLPPLWLNPLTPSFPLLGGQSGGLPVVLAPGGSSVAVSIPPGLGGFSCILQSLAVDGSGALVVSDASELQFHN